MTITVHFPLDKRNTPPCPLPSSKLGLFFFLLHEHALLRMRYIEHRFFSGVYSADCGTNINENTWKIPKISQKKNVEKVCFCEKKKHQVIFPFDGRHLNQKCGHHCILLRLCFCT